MCATTTTHTLLPSTRLRDATSGISKAIATLTLWPVLDQPIKDTLIQRLLKRLISRPLKSRRLPGLSTTLSLVHLLNTSVLFSGTTSSCHPAVESRLVKVPASLLVDGATTSRVSNTTRQVSSWRMETSGEDQSLPLELVMTLLDITSLVHSLLASLLSTTITSSTSKKCSRPTRTALLYTSSQFREKVVL